MRVLFVRKFDSPQWRRSRFWPRKGRKNWDGLGVTNGSLMRPKALPNKQTVIVSVSRGRVYPSVGARTDVAMLKRCAFGEDVGLEADAPNPRNARRSNPESPIAPAASAIWRSRLQTPGLPPRLTPPSRPDTPPTTPPAARTHRTPVRTPGTTPRRTCGC